MKRSIGYQNSSDQTKYDIKQQSYYSASKEPVHG